jgi:hypothetical protein
MPDANAQHMNENAMAGNRTLIASGIVSSRIKWGATWEEPSGQRNAVDSPAPH